ncbi:MAG: hypothetical protein V6Z86_05020 [Hyphomicrobiales bacterium]
MNPTRWLKWHDLDPTWKRFAVIGGVLVIVVAAGLLTPGDRDERNGVSSREETTRHILTDRSTREVEIDQLAASVEMVARENANLKRRIEALSRKRDDGSLSLAATARDARLKASEPARSAELSKLRAPGCAR